MSTAPNAGNPTPHMMLSNFLSDESERWDALSRSGATNDDLMAVILAAYGDGRSNAGCYLRTIPYLAFYKSPDLNKKAIAFIKGDCLDAIRNVLSIPLPGQAPSTEPEPDEREIR